MAKFIRTDPTKFEPESGCSGKVKHRTFESAKAQMEHRGHSKRKITRDGRGALEKEAGKVVIYKCPIIDPYPHWHVGKNNWERPKWYNRKKEKQFWRLKSEL